MAEQSRNSWIKKDNPIMVSAKRKDGYEDILADLRHTYDVKIFTQPYLPPVYKLNQSRSPADIKDAVLSSDRVKYTIEQIVKEHGGTYVEMQNEASKILAEMSHNMKTVVVRCFAFTLAKIFKSIYQRIYVNEDGLNRLRQLVKDNPVLFLPTHRSYVDFLLVSYICVQYDIPIPSIASAMDFMGMKLIGTMLRNCGAFFIRRTFRNDQLYWAIFNEYVQTQIVNGDSPIEFFIEGTRSRTCKTYYPKTGMLSASLEPYFKANVPDVIIQPISITYDRVLEEGLYAYELLGIPKPKESTTGLIKARKVLSENYGSVHVHFTEPISVRQRSFGHVDRINHTLTPRYISSLTSVETSFIEKLALHISCVHQRHVVISPWALTACVLMQNVASGLQFSQLVREVEWLKRQACNLGAYVNWPGNESSEDIVRSHIFLHSNLVSINNQDVVEVLVKGHQQTSKGDQLMDDASQYLMLASYRNQALHVFIRVSIMALIVGTSEADFLNLDDVMEKYNALVTLLKYEFIFHPDELKQDFSVAVTTLAHMGGVYVDQQIVDVKRSINKCTTFFSKMFEPFLLAYWVLAQYLLSISCDLHGKPQAKPSKVIVKEAQTLAALLLRDGCIRFYEILSLDLISNGLNSFLNIGAVIKEKRSDENYLFANGAVLSKISDDIGKLIEVPVLRNTKINLANKTVTINSKL